MLLIVYHPRLIYIILLVSDYTVSFVIIDHHVNQYVYVLVLGYNGYQRS
jgi:hypothetical protein